MPNTRADRGAGHHDRQQRVRPRAADEAVDERHQQEQHELLAGALEAARGSGESAADTSVAPA